jgi:hypothetical protein
MYLTKAKLSSGIYLRATFTARGKIPRPQHVQVCPTVIGAVPISADPRLEYPALIIMCCTSISKPKITKNIGLLKRVANTLIS